MTPRQKIEASAEYRQGDWFLITRAAHCAGITIAEAYEIIDQMVAEGVLVRGAGNNYRRVSLASIALHQAWRPGFKLRRGPVRVLEASR